MPPVGHYLADEVGLLAGVSGKTIGQWSRRGYIRASRSGRTYPKVYSYQDVGEAMAVHELLVRDVKHRYIKNAIESLRDEYGDWPLTKAPLLTGSGNVARRIGDDLVDTGQAPGTMYLLEPGELVRLSIDLSRGGWAAREIPDLAHIEVDPETLGGEPVIKGRRVPAMRVARLAATPEGRQTLIEDYEINEDEIRDAVRWREAVRAYDPAA